MPPLGLWLLSTVVNFHVTFSHSFRIPIKVCSPHVFDQDLHLVFLLVGWVQWLRRILIRSKKAHRTIVSQSYIVCRYTHRINKNLGKNDVVKLVFIQSCRYLTLTLEPYITLPMFFYYSSQETNFLLALLASCKNPTQFSSSNIDCGHVSQGF